STSGAYPGHGAAPSPVRDLEVCANVQSRCLDLRGCHAHPPYGPGEAPPQPNDDDQESHVSPSARDRARAKRRYAKRQANLARKAQARRTRQQVTAPGLGVLIVVGGVFGITKLTGSDKTSAKGATPGASSSASPSSSATASATPTAGACPAVTAAKVAKPQQFSTAPPKTLAANRTWTATVATTCGTMTFTL